MSLILFLAGSRKATLGVRRSGNLSATLSDGLFFERNHVPKRLRHPL
jgi:hypothetical protein